MTDTPATAGTLAPEKRHSRVPWPVIRGTAKVMALLVVVYIFGPGLIAGFRQALHELSTVNPALLGLGFALQIAALLSYSLLTMAALPPKCISVARLFRIQLSTKALSNIMPGGSAAGSALGYRLLTLSGISGTDSGFALATVGLGSAVVLNVILMIGLVVSIPLRGVNPFYGTAAIVGLLLMAIAAGIIVGLLKGQARAQRIVRWFARKLRFDPDRAVVVIQHVADRVRELITDRELLVRVLGWATANWLLDAASLWVFVRAFGGVVPIDGLIIAFGLANVLAVIPITPGGVGIIEGVMIPTLVGFGPSRATATLGVVSYRAAQYWFPILLGAISYLSLRVGPWSIERRDALKRLREVTAEAAADDTSGIEWAEKYGRRETVTVGPPPPETPPDHQEPAGGGDDPRQ